MSTASPIASLVFDGITKAFGKTAVLENLSLSLEGGQCSLLLGRNASGKSTLLRIAAGLTRPDAGTVLIGGTAAAPVGQIGYVGHQHMLYGALTLEENLQFFARLRRNQDGVETAIDTWRLSGHRHKRIQVLSKGLQARAALAACLLHSPRYIFLDEPTSSLDAESTELLKRLLTTKCGEEQVTVLIATHDLSALEPIAERIMVLEGGAISVDSKAQGKQAAVDCYRMGNR